MSVSDVDQNMFFVVELEEEELYQFTLEILQLGCCQQATNGWHIVLKTSHFSI